MMRPFIVLKREEMAACLYVAGLIWGDIYNGPAQWSVNSQMALS